MSSRMPECDKVLENMEKQLFNISSETDEKDRTILYEVKMQMYEPKHDSMKEMFIYETEGANNHRLKKIDKKRKE